MACLHLLKECSKELCPTKKKLKVKMGTEIGEGGQDDGGWGAALAASGAGQETKAHTHQQCPSVQGSSYSRGDLGPEHQCTDECTKGVLITPGIIASCSGYSILWPQLEGELVTQVGPLLRSHMVHRQLNQPNFPITIQHPMWPHLRKLLSHQFHSLITRDSEEKIISFLTTNKENYQKKIFVQVSYAIITHPLTLKFNISKSQIVILLNYVV